MSFAVACTGDGDGDVDAAVEAGADAGADAALEPVYVPTLPEPPAPIRAEPAPPAPTAEPALRSWDCPDGWAAVAHPGLLDAAGEPFSHCEPVRPPRVRLGDEVTALDEGEQQGDRPICDPAADGTFPLLGSADCQPLGDPCPADTWPTIPAEVTGARIHVLPGAPGGDGSEVAPYATIVEAVEAAADGDVVVLGPGVHSVATDRQVRVDRRLTLWGACVQRTEVVAMGPFAGHAALGAWQGGQLTVRNMRISGEQFGILVIDEGSRAEIEGVWIAETTSSGVRVEQGSARLERVLVTDARSTAGGTGIGLYAAGGAGVEVLGSTFERSHGTAVETGPAAEGAAATTLTLEDVLVRDTLGPDDAEGWGRGLNVTGASSVEVRRALVERSAYRGVDLAGGCTCDLEDVVLAGSGAGAPARQVAAGISVSDGARLTARRLAVLDSRIRGVYIEGAQTSADAEDLVVARTSGPDPDARMVIGLAAMEGAEARVGRALVEENHSCGLQVVDDGTFVEATDVVVRQTLPAQADQRLGYGVVVAADSSLHFGRLRVADSHGLGVAVESARLEGEDLFVTGTAPQVSDGQSGLGLQAAFAAQVTVTRARFDANHQVSIGAYNEGTVVVVEDLVVEGTLPGNADSGFGLTASMDASFTVRRSHVASSPSSGAMAIFAGSLVLEDARFDTPWDGEPTVMGGTGLVVWEAGSARAVRMVVDAARAYGVLVEGDGSRLQLEDVTVQRTRGHRQDQSGGHGVAAAVGGTLEVSRAELRDNRGCAVFAYSAGARVIVEDVVLAGTRAQGSDGDYGIGLCLESGSTGELRRAIIEDNTLSGVALADPGTFLAAEDVAIVGTTGGAAGSFDACGLWVDNEAELATTRTLVDGVVGVGVGVVQGAHAVLTDLTVRGVLPYPADGAWGRGLHAEDGAHVEIVGGLVEACRDLGVGAFGEDTLVVLGSTSIAGTRPQVCAADGEAADCEGHGYGLGSYHGADVRADHVELLGSAAIGIQIARGGTIHGSDVAVRRSPVGVNVQDVDDGFDLGSAIPDLLVEWCEVPEDRSDLPLPEAWGMAR